MNTNLSSVQLTKISDNPNALKNGDSVFVRVLAKEGKGNYIVSFAGSKISVFSERQLDVGTNFKALVTIQNGKLFLTPQFRQQESKQILFANNLDTLSQLKNYLLNLGLPNDFTSLKIIQYFQSFGMSFNGKIASKARSIGVKFPGKESEATEIALFLEQKGISAEFNTVQELLGIFYGNSNGQKSYYEENPESSGQKKREIENIDVLNCVYDNVQDIITKQVGMLALINHTYVNPLHWIVLPFETTGGNQNIVGSVRLLLDIDKKVTKNIIIFANFTSYNLDVVIYCSKDSVADKNGYTIQFCCCGKDVHQNENQLIETLRSSLPKDFNFDISYNGDLLRNSVFTFDSSISFVQVDA